MIKSFYILEIQNIKKEECECSHTTMGNGPGVKKDFSVIGLHTTTNFFELCKNV